MKGFIKGKWSSFLSFMNNHFHIFQYGVIILVAATFYYTPHLLNSFGFTSVKPNEFFSQAIVTPIDAIYFSVVSITTLGFGDINPTSQIMRVIVSIEVLFGIITIGQALNAMSEKAEEKKRMPHRIAAYEDVRLLTRDLVCYWANIYHYSVPFSFPSSVEELLSQESINKMGKYLDLNSKPVVTPERTWWEWLPQQVESQTKLAETILERHISVLEPQAYSYIHNLLSAGILSQSRYGLISAIRKSDEQSNNQRSSFLANYHFENAQSLKPIVELQKWCRAEYKELQYIDSSFIKCPHEVMESWGKV
jgi:hypothetical protein